MRATELLASVVVDSVGRRVGAVRDLRLAWEKRASGGSAGRNRLAPRWGRGARGVARQLAARRRGPRRGSRRAARARAWRNRLTRGPVQLRLGEDGLWYRLDARVVAELHAAPDADPAAALRFDGR